MIPIKLITPKKWLLYLISTILVGSCTSARVQVATPKLTTSPQRIVSLLPSATELIYHLGAFKRLVGVTLNDHFPPEVKSLPKVGDQKIDNEKLVSLQPDLVVLDTEFNTDQERYKDLGLHTLELSSRRLTDIVKNLKILGSALNLKQAADKASLDFLKDLENVGKVTTRQRIFIEIWGSPLMTVGAETLPDDLLLQLGIQNVYGDQAGYFQIDPEDLINRQPDIVILPVSQQKLKDPPPSIAQKLLNDANIPCKLIVIDGATFTNPTPRVIHGLSFLKKALESKEFKG